MSEREISHASAEPMSPLSNYAEQLQRDLGGNSGSPSSQWQEAPEAPVTYPALTFPETLAQAQLASPSAAAQQREAVPQAQTVAAPAPAVSRPAASISSAPGASFTNPLVSLPARCALAHVVHHSCACSHATLLIGWQCVIGLIADCISLRYLSGKQCYPEGCPTVKLPQSLQGTCRRRRQLSNAGLGAEGRCQNGADSATVKYQDRVQHSVAFAQAERSQNRHPPAQPEL